MPTLLALWVRFRLSRWVGAVTTVIFSLAQAPLVKFGYGMPAHEPKGTERGTTVDRLLGTAHRLEWRRWLIRC